MAKPKPSPLAPVRKMVPLDAPPRRVRVLQGKPWFFEADLLFIHDIQEHMGRSVFAVTMELMSAAETKQAPPMDLVLQLAYHLTASHRDDLFEREAVEVPFRKFVRMLGMGSAKAQADLVRMVMDLVGEMLAGEKVAEEDASGNAEAPAETGATEATTAG